MWNLKELWRVRTSTCHTFSPPVPREEGQICAPNVPRARNKPPRMLTALYPRQRPQEPGGSSARLQPDWEGASWGNCEEEKVRGTLWRTLSIKQRYLRQRDGCRKGKQTNGTEEAASSHLHAYRETDRRHCAGERKKLGTIQRPLATATKEVTAQHVPPYPGINSRWTVLSHFKNSTRTIWNEERTLTEDTKKA